MTHWFPTGIRRLIPRLVTTAVFAGLTAALGQDAAEPRPDPDAPVRYTWRSHLHLLEMEQNQRFNYMDRGPGDVTDRGLQYRVRTRAQVDLAPHGTTYLRLRAETGLGFDNSWDNMGVGKGQAQWNFYVKSLALGQQLGPHVELQAGGIEWDQGAGSQRAYASDDGHLVGYRMVVNPDAGAWAPSTLRLTIGYVGDFGVPSVFSRFHMGKVNYMQALAERKLNGSTTASVEADSIQDIWFARQSVHWEKLRSRWADEVMLETVVRGTDHPTAGGSFMASRPFDAAARWHAFAIYNEIPGQLYEKNGQRILLNQGEMDLGKRLVWGGSCAATKDLTVGLFGGRLLDNTPSKRWVAQFNVRYDYAKALSRLLR